MNKGLLYPFAHANLKMLDGLSDRLVMAQKWFVQSNDRIDGPFTSEEIQTRLRAGQFAAQHLVWGNGMEHWRELSWWTKESDSVDFDTVVHEVVREVWHFAQNGDSRGPFPREALLLELKQLNSLNDVLLWTKGMKEWAPLFEFHEILTSIGVNKRTFPRADINGQVTIHTNTGTKLVAPILTISEGGMGVQLDSGVTSGMAVSIDIQSPAFQTPLHAKADVRYVADGITGLRFSNISGEDKGVIVSYVRQSQTRFVLKAS